MAIKYNPTLTESVEEVARATRSLLEWMPICSQGSAGYLRRIAVEEAIVNLENALALAKL